MNTHIFFKVLHPSVLMLCLLTALAGEAVAQSVDPVFYVTTEDGEEECTTYSGSAPITARFVANPDGIPGNATYEWHFYLDADTTAYLVRYEENTEVKFTKSGQHKILLRVSFKDDNGYDVETSNEEEPLTISVSESVLVFPNAFSPNGDGINDIYKAKQGWQSIVEFQATIVNRWGQVLYQWNNPADGWDGTYKGKPVKDGVYFCYVKAKGADGRRYSIKKDVNLLRGFTEKITNN